MRAFAMTIKNIIFIVFFFAAVGYFLFNAWRLIEYIRVGKPENRFDNLPRRLRDLLVIGFAQTKIMRQWWAGALHVTVFWGFCILTLASFEVVLEGFHPQASLYFLPGYGVLTCLQDIFGVLVLAASLTFLFRRYVTKPKRFSGREMTPASRLDATIILLMIIALMVTMFIANGTHPATNSVIFGFRPISDVVGFYLGGNQSTVLFEISWWTHAVVLLVFLNYLPFSKHLHVIASLPNVFFASHQSSGVLPKMDLEAENVETFGASDIEHFTWKQLFDSYTCTECGRCTAVCPANNTGKLLSPRKIMMDIRHRIEEKGALTVGKLGSFTKGIAANGNGELPEQVKSVLAQKLISERFITPEELWACTTCQACMQECPVSIEHVPTIVDMRRYLVLQEADFPSELNTLFTNLENKYSPWAFSHDARADWAEGLEIPLMSMIEADQKQVEVLFWVGCAGAYDDRYRKVVQSVARLLKKAGISFAILGKEEKCTGDPARRAGNEYLAQMLIQENVETLNNYKPRFKTVLTSCPHCFNAIKNEWPQFGGTFEVMHHSQYLSKLVAEGRITPTQKIEATVVYHDSCYLGRSNQVYDEPRQVLVQIGSKLTEMERSRDRGMCCGAGGARMWMEEAAPRVNVERTRQALETKPDMIAAACPFCLTMLTDGLKAHNEERVKTFDIAELLEQATNGDKHV
jgi:Fe-S oxidoreductase/nitrate reductase gamma subunit